MMTAGEALGEEAARKLTGMRGDFTIGPGLDDAELDAVEHEHGFTFADDHRAFLRRVLPAGQGWPDWRSPGDPVLVSRLTWPVRGILIDVERNDTWFPVLWGPRPPLMAGALAKAERAMNAEPQLVPIFEHRYLPPGAGTFGHPVLSMHQADIICYAADLADWVDAEFGAGGRSMNEYPECTVPFWRELLG